ncbi:MAG: phosphate acyltransferase PlsX [Planctomycetes bacterium]|nr:phosphate acyltransferase PlsX [Planctomycetota bacterium]NOG54705.1 phosphate acyltransferase PlsX [Planctomycetota bacterium]
MRFALDVMGGDHAPHEILKGAFMSLDLLAPDDELVLVGDEQAITQDMKDNGIDDARLSIVASSDDIRMDDPPIDSVRAKPNSSIVKMARMAGRKAENPVDIIISAGNTGACVSAAQMHLRRLPGVHRPGIAVCLPTFGGPVVICDIGANPDPKAHHLWQYGIMAAAYCREMFGVENPTIAQLNIGGEEMKGTDIVRGAREYFQQTEGVNYIGYIEGREMFDHVADVVVTDGFVGNVVIKLSEGLASGIFKSISHEIGKQSADLVDAFKPVIKSIYARHDYHEQGGAPLLGVNGTCIICHGSSEAYTISSAIRNSRILVKNKLNEGIVSRLATVNQQVGAG